MKQRIVILLLLTFMISACLGGDGNRYLLKQYVLEYAPPRTEAVISPEIETAIRVERFSADRMFQGRSMIYRQGSYRRDAYPAQRWRVSPADMVTESLRGDLREAKQFRAVLTERDTGGVGFGLTGEVQEFLEVPGSIGAHGGSDGNHHPAGFFKGETAPLLLFQKTYHARAAITGPKGAGLAAAMSLAMADLSRQIIADIVSAVRSTGR